LNNGVGIVTLTNRQTKAEWLLILCTFIWGASFVVIKNSLADISPLLMISLRFGIALVLFLPFCYSALRHLDWKAAYQGVILGLLLLAGFAPQTVGLQYTTASKSGFITGMLVVFTPLFQLMIERRPPKRGNVIGIFMVVIGLYLLTSPQGSEFNRGDALTLLCAVIFALYIVYLDIFTKQSNAVVLTFLQMVVVTVVAGVFALGMDSLHVQWTPNLFFSLAYLSVLATVVTLTIQTIYQKETTPTRAAVIFSLEPVFSALAAYAFAGERIGGVGVLGGVIILAGLLISELSDTIFRTGMNERVATTVELVEEKFKDQV
jgi:drug/metabolite transporter (DMT)-like permease